MLLANTRPESARQLDVVRPKKWLKVGPSERFLIESVFVSTATGRNLLWRQELSPIRSTQAD